MGDRLATVSGSSSLTGGGAIPRWASLAISRRTTILESKVKDFCPTPSGSHFLRSNFFQLGAIPSMRLSATDSNVKKLWRDHINGAQFASNTNPGSDT